MRGGGCLGVGGFVPLEVVSSIHEPKGYVHRQETPGRAQDYPNEPQRLIPESYEPCVLGLIPR